MATVSEFRQHIFDNGITKQNRFSVVFTLPPGLSVPGGIETLQLMTQNTSFAGFNLDTDDARVNGVPYKSVYQKNNNEIDFTFIVGRDMVEKVVFDRWKDIIVNNNTQTLSYPDSYKVDILIKNESGSFQKTLIKAFPSAVTSIDMDRSSSNAYATFSATFSYKYIEDVTSAGTGTNTIIQAPDLGSGLLGFISPINKFVSDVIKTTDDIVENVSSTISNGINSVLGEFSPVLGNSLGEAASLYRNISTTIDKYKKFGSTNKIKGYLSGVERDVVNNLNISNDEKLVLRKMITELKKHTG